MGFLCVLLAAVTPLRIVPNKIVYPQNEKGYATVVLTNRAAVAAQEPVVVSEAWGLEGAGREIWRGEVSLAPGEGKTIKVDYPGSDVRYGHELRVTAGGVSRAEYFNVNDAWWRVNLGCDLEPRPRMVTPLYRQFLEYYGFAVEPAQSTAGQMPSVAWQTMGLGMGPFAGYHTMETRWQMQKSSVGGNKAAADMPDGVQWITPNGSMPRDSGLIRADSDRCHEWGARHTRFTINLMEGPYGFELARKHPEYMLRNGRGQYEGLYMDSETDPVKISIPDNPKAYPWTYLEPNFFREDVLDWALADLEAAVEGFHEDGVYFDGRYLKRQGFDAFGADLQRTTDSANIQVRNMRKTQQVLLEGHPNRFIWSNGANPDVPEMTLLDHPRSGLLNEIQWTFLLHPTMSCNNYRGFLESTLASRNMCYLPSKWAKKPGKVHIVGYLCPSWASRNDQTAAREQWTMGQHIMAIVASTLGHPFAGGLQMRNFKQMQVRYSECFWHEDIEVMKDGYKHFMCDSLREVWYDDTIYVRKGEGFTDYYVHLLNVPEEEMCNELTPADPPEVDDAEVSTKLFGTDKVKAWAIQPYGYMAAKLEPTCAEVKAKSIKGETIFAIPPFKYYTLLVIRKYK